MDRLTYDPAAEQLTYRSDKADGPTAGTQALDPLEFLARFSAEPHPAPPTHPGPTPARRPAAPVSLVNHPAVNNAYTSEGACMPEALKAVSPCGPCPAGGCSSGVQGVYGLRMTTGMLQLANAPRHRCATRFQTS